MEYNLKDNITVLPVAIKICKWVLPFGIQSYFYLPNLCDQRSIEGGAELRGKRAEVMSMHFNPGESKAENLLLSVVPQ